MAESHKNNSSRSSSPTKREKDAELEKEGRPVSGVVFNYTSYKTKSGNEERNGDRDWERVNWIFPFKLKIEFYASLSSFHECMLHVFSWQAFRQQQQQKNLRSLTVKLSGKTKSINVYVYMRVGCTLYSNSNSNSTKIITENNIQKYVGWVVGKDLMGKCLFAFFSYSRSQLFIHSTKIKCHTFELNCAQQKSVKLKLYGKMTDFFLYHTAEEEKKWIKSTECHFSA